MAKDEASPGREGLAVEDAALQAPRRQHLRRERRCDTAAETRDHLRSSSVAYDG